jgi:hypothetical protein
MEVAMPARPPCLAPAFSAAALALSLAVGPTHAQVLSELPPGTRVRVTSTSPELRRKVATVVEAEADRLVVTFGRAKRDTVAIDSTAVRALEVSRGRQRNVGRGAALGLLAGLASGAVFAAVVDTCDPDSFCFEPSKGEVFITTAVLGLGVGSLVALVAPRERWERWPRGPERGLAPTVVPNGRGSGVNVGLRLATPPLGR